MSREDFYAAVQRNAMEAWRGNASFLALCRADKEIRQFLADDELVALSDMGYHPSTSTRFLSGCLGTFGAPASSRLLIMIPAKPGSGRASRFRLGPFVLLDLGHHGLRGLSTGRLVLGLGIVVARHP